MKTLKTTEPKQNGEMEPPLGGVTVSPEECTLNGNKQMLITFCEGVQFPKDGMVVVFRGSESTHTVQAQPLNSLTFTVLIPAHHKPEQIALSVIDGKDASRVIYRSQFIYTAAPQHYIAELLVQSVSGTPQLDALMSFVPPLNNKAEIAAFDAKLTTSFSGIALPRDWTLLGYENLKRANSGDTLLHFSAQLGLNTFVKHLLKLPGAKEAVNMDNEWGLSPIEVASQNSNDHTAKLLNDFAAITCGPTLLSSGTQGHHLSNRNTGVGASGYSQNIDNTTDDYISTVKQQIPQGSLTLAKIKPKIDRGGAEPPTGSVNDLTTNLVTTCSNSCPSLLAVTSMDGTKAYTCVSTSSTNSDDLTSSEDNSPEPKRSHRHSTIHKHTKESKNGASQWKTQLNAAAQQFIKSKAVSSSSTSPDMREDSVTPVQFYQIPSDQEGTLKATRQTSTPASTSKSAPASADSSPSIKRVTSISVYVSNKKTSPSPSRSTVSEKHHDLNDDDDLMKTQSAPDILSPEKNSTIDEGDKSIDDGVEEASKRVGGTSAYSDALLGSESSSESEISSIDDIHLSVTSSDSKGQSSDRPLRRPSQNSVKHSVSDHCLLDRATSPVDSARKRLSDIPKMVDNDPGLLYSTGSEPAVSAAHISSSDLNLSSTEEYTDIGDSTDTLDDLYAMQQAAYLRQGGSRSSEYVVRYRPSSAQSHGNRPRSADITHAMDPKTRRVHAISSPHAVALRKVYSSSNIDDFRSAQSITAFRSHNRLHPKLVEEMQDDEDKMSHSYPPKIHRTGSGGSFFSKFSASKNKRHPVTRNNSDVSGLKKQAGHVTLVKRSVSAASDSSYAEDRSSIRENTDYSTPPFDGSSLNTTSSSRAAGIALLPPSPLISNITPVESTVAYHRKSGTLSPPVPMLPAEDEEPVENVMSQPSIAGIMQSRKPLLQCDPEIESSLDRTSAVWTAHQQPPEAPQKGHKKDKHVNLKRAQTMGPEHEGSHKKFGLFSRRQKDKNTKRQRSPATVKQPKPTNSSSATYPRPNSSSANYASSEGVNPQDEATKSVGTDVAYGNVFPTKRANPRQTSRSDVRSIHFSPTMSPEEVREKPAAASDHDTEYHRHTMPLRSAKVSASSTNIIPPKHDNVEQRKTRSSSELLCEGEKEATGVFDNSLEEEEEAMVRNQEDESVAKVFSSMPELFPDYETPDWADNVPTAVLSKLSKVEKDRQAIIYELIQTENHILVALQILLIMFKKSFQDQLKLPEDILEQMFPHLDPLLVLTKEFYSKLKQRQDEATNCIMDKIGDVLVEHFTGEKGDEVASVYGAFCSRQLRALDIYREQVKLKRFHKLATSFTNSKVCQRRNYPEFITLLAQRITKYPHLLDRLHKKTDSKHADAENLELALTHSVKVTSRVNEIVDQHTRHEQLLEIQSNLEIHLPRVEKDEATRKELKSLNLMANGRNMIKIGHAKWIGSPQHSQEKELSVVVVLVTDMVVLLTKGDQKYNLACLQDRKPPVIRLFDLHARVNEASVKSSGCELFLMEGGKRPEFFTLQWANDKVLREWKVALDSQVSYCKENNLRCERFGNVHAPTTSEDKKEQHHEEKVRHGSVKKREKKKSSLSNRKEKYMSLCQDAIEMAKNLLPYSPSLQNFSQLQNMSSRYGSSVSVASVPSAPVAVRNQTGEKGSPRTRSRANTVIAPKHASFIVDDMHMVNVKGSKQRGVLKTKGSKVERSQTFLGKEEKRDRTYVPPSYSPQTHRNNSSSNSGANVLDDLPDGAHSMLVRDPREQLQLRCIEKLMEALEGIREVMLDQDSTIKSLQDELIALKGVERSVSLIEDNHPAEQMTSKTETDLLSMIERPLNQQTFSGLSWEDLRHSSSSNVTHPSRQPNGSIARPLSCSSDLPPSSLLGREEASNFDRQTSNDS